VQLSFSGTILPNQATEQPTGAGFLFLLRLLLLLRHLNPGWQPWEPLREQVILGGESFVDKVRSAVTGDPQEQRSASRLVQVRPSLQSVIACVERIRGEKWEEFRDRHADLGRDLVLYLGRSVCAMKLSELAQGVGVTGDASVAMAIGRYAQQLTWNGVERERVQKAGDLLNVKM
jgi:hypothetical protein